MVTKPAPVAFCGHCECTFPSRQAAYNHMIEIHPPKPCPGCGLDMKVWQTVYPGNIEHQCRPMAEDARQQESHEAQNMVDGFEETEVTA